MGVDFGKFRKTVEGTDDKRTSERTTAVPEPAKRPVSRTNYKKQAKEKQKVIETYKVRFQHMEEEIMSKEARISELENSMSDEVDMLRRQETQQKQVIDLLTKEIEQFKFRPQHYSQIAQLLVSMRVRGNRAQKEAVMNIVGSTDIVEVRKYIFKLLEAPYK